MTDLIVHQILSKLGVLALEHHSDGQLTVLGTPPAWAFEVLGCIRNRFTHLLPIDISPFLENFITDAEEFWREAPGEELRSGLWTETFHDHQDINLEAVAIFINDRKIILIESSNFSYSEKLSWLQIARQEQLQILSERKVSATRMMSATFYDSLTGLPNHTFFTAQLSQLTANLNQVGNQKFACLNLNLDRFQNINNSLGRDCGDQLLIEMAQRIKTSLDAEDIAARLGSDEFGILLVGFDTKEKLDRKIVKLQNALEQPYTLNEQSIFTSVSIGLVIADQSGQNARHLFRDVCTAMNHAKGLGRGHLVQYDAKMHDQAMRLLNLENDLHFAIKNHELFHEYQAIISLKTHQMIGVDGLIRWQHQNAGILYPQDFIPLATDSLQIKAIDEYNLLAAGQLLNHWQQTFNDMYKINVRISSQTLTDSGLQPCLKMLVREFKFAPAQLMLQFTEQAILTDRAQASQTLHAIAKMGFSLCLSDVSTRFSSLSNFFDIPFQFLKLEGRLVQLLDEQRSSIVGEIIKSAHDCNLQVIGDQVETVHQHDVLTQLNCDFAQGQFFSSPCSQEEIESFMTQHFLFEPPAQP